MTPEGKVKSAVKKLLSEYNVYSFMPVPSGYGASSVDYLVCHAGRFAGIETKTPGKHPTPRQQLVLEQIAAAGGTTFVIDGSEGIEELRAWLSQS